MLAGFYKSNIFGSLGYGRQFISNNIYSRKPRWYVTKHALTQEFETEEEKAVFNKLMGALEPKQLAVHDISGGCGSMYEIIVKSEKFNSLTTIKQHKLVNSILKEEIASWHGLQLSTKKDK